MTAHDPSRREFTHALTLATIGAAFGVAPTRQHDADVSRNAEAIHQVIHFNVPPARVYNTLMDPREFMAIMKFSTVPDAPEPTIEGNVGGTFALFGGHILGRHIELVPGTRVVQAWRTSGWPVGLYSIARFELASADGGTKLSFDHTGFPKGDGAHLANGWYLNYWTPMEKHFAGR
ncbi:MAG TPA: SRPBCC domain-containing protein [Gemmatimonadaceae bacterium]|jgi:activator of HSP90 ATPase